MARNEVASYHDAQMECQAAEGTLKAMQVMFAGAASALINLANLSADENRLFTDGHPIDFAEWPNSTTLKQHIHAYEKARKRLAEAWGKLTPEEQLAFRPPK